METKAAGAREKRGGSRPGGMKEGASLDGPKQSAANDKNRKDGVSVGVKRKAQQAQLQQTGESQGA